MKAPTRLLITATTLAALTMLGPAATAAASVPTPPGGQQHPTTVEPGTGPQPGHGAQLYHDAHDTDPATMNQSSNDATTSADYAFAPSIPALAATLAGLLVGLAGTPWLRRRHRRRPTHDAERRPHRMREATEPTLTADRRSRGLDGELPLTGHNLRGEDLEPSRSSSLEPEELRC